MISYSFWQGTRMHQCYYENPIVRRLVQQQQQEGNSTDDSPLGRSSPLLTVLGLPQQILTKHIQGVNKAIAKENVKQVIEVSLINGARAVVCSGTPEQLLLLVSSLQKIQAQPNEDQSRVPFSKRKMNFTLGFLEVSTPFHSKSFLTESIPIIQQDVQRLKINYNLADLVIPVYSTLDGTDLRSMVNSKTPNNLMDILIQLQSVDAVNWPLALQHASYPSVSHIVDFGPGHLTGSAGLTSRIKEGTGVGVIVVGSEREDPRTINESILYADNIDQLPRQSISPQNWSIDYFPHLRRLSTGKLIIDTKFSRLIGKPPIMVAGMTPTTANEQIVIAFTNSGYHGEFAGGGQVTEDIFRERIKNIQNNIKPTEGIHVNILYLNPRLWNFQFPSCISMRSQEGVPIESICVAAGIPSLEKATEIITAMKNAGMTFVAFKPGSIDAIKQVVNIAEAHPEMSIVVQWTGGRGGGHHSFEDVHEPILETYAMLRRRNNIVLLMGSGIGGAEDATDYLTGHWSVTFGYPPMPFDGLLVASRVMVAQEALTSNAVKDLIVKTPGVSNEQWERTYDEDAGGILTVISELGEPIHKVATRGVKLWKEFDQKFFSLPLQQQEKALLEHKDYIIKRLNEDFQRVYFGKKSDGRTADLNEMTYAEVLKRMIDIMFSREYQQWIHSSYQQRFELFAKRTMERLYSANSQSSPVLNDSVISTKPDDFFSGYVQRYPSSTSQLLTEEDVDYFINLCKERGKKPVNFIPAIDKEFQFWFKKDSLWQSENLEFIQDKDEQRVIILQGPVAVQHSKVANEPIGKILGDLNDGIIKNLHQKHPGNFQIPTEEYFGGPSIRSIRDNNLPPSVVVQQSTTADEKKSVIFKTKQIYLHKELPAQQDWLEYLAGDKYSWIRAVITSPQLVHERKKINNYLATILRPRAQQRIEIKSIKQQNQDEDIVSLRIFDSHTQEQPAAELTREKDEITLKIYNFLPLNQQFIPLTLRYAYHPDTGYAPIETITSTDNTASTFNNVIKQFYTKLWFGPDFKEDFSKWRTSDKFVTEKTLTRDSIELFCNAINAKPPVVEEQNHAKRMVVPVFLYCNMLGGSYEDFISTRSRCQYVKVIAFIIWLQNTEQ